MTFKLNKFIIFSFFLLIFIGSDFKAEDKLASSDSIIHQYLIDFNGKLIFQEEDFQKFLSQEQMEELKNKSDKYEDMLNNAHDIELNNLDIKMSRIKAIHLFEYDWGIRIVTDKITVDRLLD